jgi:Phosphotransferase enzyme family
LGHQREDKPPWSAVPRVVKDRVEAVLGLRVVRAVRSYGGYGPSATFLLTLGDGSRAFFKGTYPLPQGSAVKWSLEEEEKVYSRLAALIDPWAPAYLGSIRVEGWHALLIEAVYGERVVPWTRGKACRAARSYAAFHAATAGRPLPRWLPRDAHLEFARYWQALEADRDARGRLAVLAGPNHAQAADWLRASIGALAEAEKALATAGPPFALLHSDTRSDNIRLDGDLLRMFDWPFACVGPPEFDLAAFAQSIESEGGPDAADVTKWYSEIRPVRAEVMTAAVVGIAGYFADRAPRPDVPGLPRLRSVQRRQLKASLPWAARLLGLPEPAWLDGVAD